ncbi:HNH endonuclease signature motif containing protein [Rhizobium phaseoli]|uniref:HNH endonuclease signature motif containing protein n=1 Tax=Rhizobium phaseoli TaxID=396 RepID=UPI000BE93FB9|nr:HNH endonuclease signature motif containing protein [Rhizobium phaseoli]PDS68906.1 hypothetical protein CO651_26335 [Rhizobium phaseoli]
MTTAANDNEEWRVSATSADYAVSSLGRAKRLSPDRMGRGGDRILKLRPLPTGYLRYAESCDGICTDRYIHRAVCEAFHGPPPSDLHEVAHRDGDKSHNGEANLYWATHVENEADKIVHGTKLTGEDVGNSKLTVLQVAEIRKLLGSLAQHKIAKKFGISQMAVSKIHRGLLWRDAA